MRRTLKRKGMKRGKARMASQRRDSQAELILHFERADVEQQLASEQYWAGRNHAMRRSARIAA